MLMASWEFARMNIRSKIQTECHIKRKWNNIVRNCHRDLCRSYNKQIMTGLGGNRQIYLPLEIQDGEALVNRKS